MRTWYRIGVAVSAGFFLAMASAVMAGDPDHTSAPGRQGPWALLFQMKGNLVLAPMEDARLSVQHDLGSTDAVRLSAGISERSSNLSLRAQDNDERSIDLSATYVRYRSRGEDVSFFCGIGPATGFSHQSRLEGNMVPTDSVPNHYQEESTSDEWYLGGQALLGAEWLLTPHIAVTGEYSFSARYTSDHMKSSYRRRVGDGPWETLDESISDKTARSTGDMVVRLGLVIYL